MLGTFSGGAGEDRIIVVLFGNVQARSQGLPIASSNCHWQSLPSRAEPHLLTANKNTQQMLGTFSGGAGEVLPLASIG
jgi:hypothetical protein